jgi:hypothetical protein
MPGFVVNIAIQTASSSKGYDMKISSIRSSLAVLPVLTVLLSGVNAFAGDEVGVAKVASRQFARPVSAQVVQEEAVIRGQSPVVNEVVYEDCDCDNCRGNRCGGTGKFHRWWAYHMGYFIPKGGADGKGLPPFGHYHRVYSVDPQYFDSRDGNVYAAQGYGVPVAVPLAPTVHHTYNYSWGVPSSRLTPVGNVTSSPY